MWKPGPDQGCTFSHLRYTQLQDLLLASNIDQRGNVMGITNVREPS